MMNSALRKALALLLCAALCVSLIPAAFAEEGFTFPDGTVIEDTIAFPEPDPEELMAGFTVSEEPALSTEETLSFEVPDGAFIIPTGTKKIEEEAFAGVLGMTSVAIPAAVAEIGDGAFDGCTRLAEVYFSGTGAQWSAVTVGTRNEALLTSMVILMPAGERWIPVTARYFPDSLFRSYISLNYDKNNDGWLSGPERDAVTQMTVAGKEGSPLNIQSLKGIEWFSKLAALTCAYDRLETLDVSQNKNLELLNCAGNVLTALDVSGNTKLRELHCSSNKLTSLKLNTGLMTLYAHYNSLGDALDLTKCTELANFYAAYNLFKTLDLSQNTKLLNVELLGNSLTSLDLSKSTLLQKLLCGRNALQTLNCSSNTLLQSLDCHTNNLYSLNVSRCADLSDLNCAENRLQTLDVSACTSLERLQCYTNQLTSLTLGFHSGLDRLNCAGNRLTELNISQSPLLVQVYKTKTPVQKGTIIYYYTDDNSPYLVFDQPVSIVSGAPTGIPVTDVNFPDSAFRAFVSQNCDTNHDGYLSTSEIDAVTSLSLSGRSIYSLKGIEYFSSLTSLYCTDNYLTSLDVSRCSSLELLHCFRNRLTTLTLGTNTRLARLNCAYNNLSQLDIRQNPRLVQVYKEITPVVKDGVTNYFVNNSSPYLVLDQVTTLITGTSPTPTPTGGVPITAEYFPDPVFRSLVSELGDKNKDYILSEAEGNAVTVMYLNGRGIYTLKGIEYFPRITTLRCCSNYLTSLDISGLPNLQILECWGNQLSRLYVSNNYYLRQALYNGTRSRVVHGGSYCVRYTYNANVYFECDEGINIY
jgi:hypothetical protein